MKQYFKGEYVEGYEIFFRVDYYKEKQDMYLDAQKIQLSSWDYRIINPNGTLTDKLYINDLVICNTDAQKDVSANGYARFTDFDYMYIRLEKNLEKEVNGK